MTYHTYLPAGFLAVALIAGGTMVATAQESGTTADTQTAQAPVAVRGNERERRGMRGHARGRGDGGEMMRTLMGRVDADGDGAITLEEIDSFRAATVSDADASGDGALSLDEFQTIWMKVMNERMVDAFQRLDADGSGSIDEAEIDRPMARMIDRMDRDGDGTRERPGRRG